MKTQVTITELTNSYVITDAKTNVDLDQVPKSQFDGYLDRNNMEIAPIKLRGFKV